MGGIVESEADYIAVGLGDDKQTLANMDISLCSRTGPAVQLQHFLLESTAGPPFPHRSPLRLSGSDLDTRTVIAPVSLQPTIVWSRKDYLNLKYYFY